MHIWTPYLDFAMLFFWMLLRKLDNNNIYYYKAAAIFGKIARFDWLLCSPDSLQTAVYIYIYIYRFFIKGHSHMESSDFKLQEFAAIFVSRASDSSQKKKSRTQ